MNQDRDLKPVNLPQVSAGRGAQARRLHARFVAAAGGGPSFGDLTEAERVRWHEVAEEACAAFREEQAAHPLRVVTMPDEGPFRWLREWAGVGAPSVWSDAGIANLARAYAEHRNAEHREWLKSDAVHRLARTLGINVPAEPPGEDPVQTAIDRARKRAPMPEDERQHMLALAAAASTDPKSWESLKAEVNSLRLRQLAAAGDPVAAAREQENLHTSYATCPRPRCRTVNAARFTQEERAEGHARGTVPTKDVTCGCGQCIRIPARPMAVAFDPSVEEVLSRFPVGKPLSPKQRKDYAEGERSLAAREGFSHEEVMAAARALFGQADPNRFHSAFPDAIPWRERAPQDALAHSLAAANATDAEAADIFAATAHDLRQRSLRLAVSMPFSVRVDGKGEG